MLLIQNSSKVKIHHRILYHNRFYYFYKISNNSNCICTHHTGVQQVTSPSTISSSLGGSVMPIVSAVTAAGGASAALHQMPSVITKPKILVSQPSSMLNVTANGPEAASAQSVPNGTHQDTKVIKDGMWQ